MRIKNLPQVIAQVQARIEKHHRTVAEPWAKKVAYLAGRSLVSGFGPLPGTPQWSGNAAANWYAGPPGFFASFEEFFQVELGADEEDRFSNMRPNPEAISMSLNRITSYILGATSDSDRRMTIQFTNPTPYLKDYRGYGGFRNFREANQWPLTPKLVKIQTRNAIKALRFVKGK